MGGVAGAFVAAGGVGGVLLSLHPTSTIPLSTDNSTTTDNFLFIVLKVSTLNTPAKQKRSKKSAPFHPERGAFDPKDR